MFLSADTIMYHDFVGSYQNIFGSRKFSKPSNGVTTGLFLYLMKRASVVLAVSHALHLHLLAVVYGVRCVERHDSVLAEASRVASVYDGAAREDMSHRVASDSGVEMLPVDEVAAYGVSPVHVAPLRAVGVVLEVEVILAVLVCQTVRVVHPSVERSVMVDGAVVVGVACVERVGELQLFQSLRILSETNDFYDSLLAFRKFERHAVVGLADSEANVHPCVSLLAVVEQHLSLGAVLLNKQDEM